ncbi:MAG: response regulator transcription factor [Vampirovibrio sp.]|jgi:two-component system phosphate regulon response regulator PhoB|nr:response regulator transcription factor [Vampirovibrio sp.]
MNSHLTPRVLVVDDEKDLVRLVKYNLEQEGYAVFCAFNGAEALDLAWTKQPDVIVLDLMLPDASGFRLCQEIKAILNPDRPNNPVRILMLTARSAEADRIEGFESGTDDYVVKPFSPRELVLRVKALLDRNKLETAPAQNSSSALEIGAIRVDAKAHRAWVADEELKLTPIEFKILWVLAQHLNAVRTREQLLKQVWENGGDEILDRTVDAHVKRLRSKLGIARDQLETVRGIGYRLYSGGGIQ